MKYLYIFAFLICRFRDRNKYRVLDQSGWVYINYYQKPTKRYYSFKEKDYGDECVKIHIEEDCLTQNKILLKPNKKVDEDVKNVELNSIKCENNLTLLTAEYNKQLTEHPSDIDLWIKFVNHQVRFYFIHFVFEKYNFLILLPNRKLYIL